MALPDVLLQGIGQFKLGSISLADFDMERHPNGNMVVKAGGTSAFLLVGTYTGPPNPKIPSGVKLALRYVLTYHEGVNTASSASSARRLVGDITALHMVQDHPALVKPIGWFTTPQDFAAIGIYVKHRSLKLPLDDSPMDVDWCMLPLFEYVLYDVVNEHRSFVHLFPSEGRVEVAWDRCANQLTMWPSGRRQKCSGLQRCPQTRRGCYNH